MVLRADGRVQLLDRRADPLLGAELEVRREDHGVDLLPGDQLVLYTDGMVERRGTPLGQSLEWLRRALEDLPRSSAAATCDGLLALIGRDVADDVAVVAARLL